MKKNYFLALFFATAFCSAQVGINTTTPKATLDVALKSNYISGEKAGVAIPNLTGDQIVAMNKTDLKAGTLVYATQVSTDALVSIDASTFWWYNGVKWITFYFAPKSFFYPPSIVLPTNSANLPTYVTFNAGTYTINLHTDVYAVQYGMTDSTNSTKSPSATNLQVIPATGLEYFVPYYDKNVFTNVAVTDAGILTYKVVESPIVTENTYMNIVFKVK